MLQNIIWIILLVGINCATFLKAKDYTFVWNDTTQIVENEFINPPARDQIRRVWAGDAPGPYTPVTSTFLAALANVDRHLSEPATSDVLNAKNELHAKTFHLGNIILHIANSILVFLLLSMLLKRTVGAALGSLIFALHPLQTEAIASVSNVGYLLGSFFAFFSLLKYLEFSRKQNSLNRKARNSLRKYYIATGSFLLAMLAMPTMAVTPIVAFILEKLLPRERGFMAPRKSIWPLLFWVILSLPIIILTITSQETAAVANELPFWARPLIAADAITFYLQKIVLPIGIGPDYGRSPNLVLSYWWSYLTWILPLMITFYLLFWKEKSRSWIAGGFLVFFVALTPFLGLIAFEAQGTSTVASKYAYFSLLGPAIIIAYLATLPRKIALRTLLIAAVIALGFSSSKQIDHWRSDDALWKMALEVNDSSPIAHRILADKFRNQGAWAKAKEHYLMVLKSNKTDAETNFFLAQVEEKQGNQKAAIPLYQRVLTLDPGFSMAHDALGQVLLANSDPIGALAHFRKSAELNANDPQSLQHLGKTLVLLEKYQEAIPILRKALKIGSAKFSRADSAATQALLGKTLAAIGQKEMGQIHLESALRLDPNHADANKILADSYIMQGKFDEALKHYLKAVESFPNDSEVLNNLGVIYLGKLDYIKAKPYFERAIKINPAFVSAMENLGIVNFFLHDYAAAKDQFVAALGKNSELPECRYYLGEIAWAQGSEELALAHYYAALKIKPDHGKTNSRLGDYFMKHDNAKAAVKHYRMAVKASPDDKKLAFRLQSAEKLKNSTEM